jgi:hypothetical protein
MDLSQQLKNKNVAEYLLYRWQQEDLLRAYGLDADKLEEGYLSQFEANPDLQQEMREELLAQLDMMREEGLAEQGHLQVNSNIIILLDDLHAQLLKSSKHPFYTAAFYKALPYIVELRQRSQTTNKSEVENSFDALYGLLMLRLQGKEISKETLEAMKAISDFLAMLAEYYKKEKEGEVEF